MVWCVGMSKHKPMLSRHINESIANKEMRTRVLELFLRPIAVLLLVLTLIAVVVIWAVVAVAVAAAAVTLLRHGQSLSSCSRMLTACVGCVGTNIPQCPRGGVPKHERAFHCNHGKRGRVDGLLPPSRGTGFAGGQRPLLTEETSRCNRGPLL
mgnify:CR=1 FL=1